MNLYSTASFIASTSCIVLGYYVYLKDRGLALNRSFALIACLAGIWTSFPFLASLPQAHDTALFLTRGVYLFAAFVPPAFYYFVLVLTDIDVSKHPAEKRQLLYLSLASCIFMALSFHPHFITGVFRDQPFFVVDPGPLYIPFIIFFLLGSAHTFYQYFKGYARSAGGKRNQLNYVLVAFLLAHIAAGMHFLATYIHAEPIPHDFLLILFSSIITYAIVKHRIMDITVAMQEGLVHIVTVGVVIVPFSMIFLLIQEEMGLSHSRSETIAMFALLTSIAIAAYVVKTSAKDTIARRLFRSRYDRYDTLSRFSGALVTILDVRTLTAEIVDTLARVIGIKTASLYLLDNERDSYVLSSSVNRIWPQGSTHRLKKTDPLPHFLARSHKILVRDDLNTATSSDQRRPLIAALKDLDAEVCIPLVNKNHLIGFCNLGTRTDNSIYSDDDLRLLTTLGQNAAIALDNATLYEERKRSQILMHRTDRLRSMETIAAGFAHEIRNPLTSIKTFMQLAPHRKDDPEFNGYFYRVAADDVARIERLIQEILDYSRYREPDFKKEDLNDIVASSLYFIELQAYRKAMTIHKEFTETLPEVTLDRQQIKQVLMNLFLNALDAMHAPGSELRVKTLRMMKPDDEEWVQISVTDSGTGIPAINLEHIFDPFYSTKHQSTDREGTGLGLTIVHQIVHDHCVNIEVSSQPGTGTTFFVNLPVNQLQLKPQPV